MTQKVYAWPSGDWIYLLDKKVKEIHKFVEMEVTKLVVEFAVLVAMVTVGIPQALLQDHYYYQVRQLDLYNNDNIKMLRKI